MEQADVPTCPECLQGRGRATAVTVSRDERTITYKCDQCEHTWPVTVDDSELPLG